MSSATEATAYFPETSFMVVAMVILAVQLLVIVLTCSVACGMVCYCRRKFMNGQSQKGKCVYHSWFLPYVQIWTTQPSVEYNDCTVLAMPELVVFQVHIHL